MAAAKLLLDFDGVILRNKKLSDYQVRRSAEFVKKHVPLPFKDCYNINKQYYPEYGHTVIMVNNLFNKRTTLEEYNEFVYNKKQLAGLVLDPPSFEHGNAFNMFANENTYIFSNAPEEWVGHFSEMLELNIKNCICPRTLEDLKPLPRVYSALNARFSGQKIVFVDDSKKNLRPVSNYANWKTMHFTAADNACNVFNVL